VPDTAATELTLCWPRAARIAFTVFFLVWCGGLVPFFLSPDAEEAGLLWQLLPAAMLACGIVGFVRMLRIQVQTHGDELMVRNPWRTHRIARSDIAGFSTGRYQRVGHQRVYADLRDGGEVRLVALDPLPLQFRDRAVEPALDRLEAWRTGTGTGTTVGA
jgi:hypothetical protein